MSRVGGKYKPRKAHYTCVCEWCHRIFQSTRPDAKTDTARCRKALSRYTSKEYETIQKQTREVVIKSRSKVVGQIELPDIPPSDRYFYKVS